MANVSSSNGLEKRPKLRFPGFDEQYKQCRIGDIYAERSQRGASDMELLSVTMNDGVKPRSEIEGKDNSSEDKSNYKIVRKGDMVYNSMRMWQGANGISPCDGIVSPAYTVLMPKQEINNGYFAALFKSTKLINEFRKNSQGMTSDTWNLKYPQIETIKVQIPSVSEQDKVSALFSVLDARIVAQAQLVESLKKYKRGLLMHFFSDETTRQWRQYTISQIGKVITGSTPPTNDRSNYDGDLMFCSPGDIGEQKYISSTEKRVSPKGFALGRPIPPSSVIVTCIGLIGKLGIATSDMITNQQINALIVSGDFDHEFIYYAFENFFPKYRSKVSMQTLPILSKSEFERLLIKVPNLNVQRKISNYLAGMDKRIEQTQQELNMLQELRRGIIQKLFI